MTQTFNSHTMPATYSRAANKKSTGISTKDHVATVKAQTAAQLQTEKLFESESETEPEDSQSSQSADKSKGKVIIYGTVSILILLI